MEEADKKPKGALREGNTLRAKFFRWKDRVTDGAHLDQAHGPGTSVPVADPAVVSKAMQAMQALVASPDDQEAYATAVSSFRGMAAALKASGLRVNLEATEE